MKQREEALPVKAGDYIFVYGTLKSDERASLERSPLVQLVGKDSITGVIKSGHGYPGVKLIQECFKTERDVVHGEVYVVLDERVGRNLDIYEGHPSLFFRQKVETLQGRPVWVYEYMHSFDGWRDVPSGSWSHMMLTDGL